MKTLLLIILSGAAAFAQTGAAGHWQGTITVGEREMPITVDLVKNEKGAWAGNFGIQTAQGLDMTKIKSDEKTVQFEVSGLPNTPVFDCKLDGGQMDCDITTNSGSVKAQLKRTGEGKITTPVTSPAVAKELEGDWQGTIETSGGSVPLVVHFANQPDKSVKATLDSPTQNTNGMRLTDVVSKDSALEFKLPLVRGAYKGTLNKEGTAITGTWSQGDNALPLNLKRVAAP